MQSDLIMNQIKNIYYAHSMRIYNSDREKEDLKFISEYFKEYHICNPNGDIVWRGSMEPYYNIIRKSDLVIFSEYMDCIGKGVFEEIKVALKNNIPVLLLRKYNKSPKNNYLDGYVLFEIEDVIDHDINDWKIRYGKVIIKGIYNNEESD